jgi:hypothetical protein
MDRHSIAHVWTRFLIGRNRGLKTLPVAIWNIGCYAAQEGGNNRLRRGSLAAGTIESGTPYDVDH